MTSSAALQTSTLVVAGETNVGLVREANEDAYTVDAAIGLYAVYDGMGGANAGEVAAQMARDVVHAKILARDKHADIGETLAEAIRNACLAIHEAGLKQYALRGMGTTAVACLFDGDSRAAIAHVGDSRAYLLRSGRISQLTRDHTIVAELIERGVLRPEDADDHPYKSALSRNLGAQPSCNVDVTIVELQPGDRLLLCSDGLYGYCAHEAIQHQLGSGDQPEHIAHELVEVALRGGGGDNVTTIVIEKRGLVPSSTQVVRTSGAIAWWQHRRAFVAAAESHGMATSPLAAGLMPSEALEMLASSPCEAIFHDLEKSTGVHVWTFAHGLSTAWLHSGQPWPALRAVLDAQNAAAHDVITIIEKQDQHVGELLDLAVTRALVVAELAAASVMTEQLRELDAEIIELGVARQRQFERAQKVISTAYISGSFPRFDTPRPGTSSSEFPAFVEQATVPFIRSDRASTADGSTPEMLGAIRGAIRAAYDELTTDNYAIANPDSVDATIAVLTTLEAIALDADGATLAELSARELFGVRTIDDAGMMPLFDRLDRVRVAFTDGVLELGAATNVQAATVRRLSLAHQRLVGALTGLVIASTAPSSEYVREAQAVTAALREQLASEGKRIAALERKFATTVDVNAPWGMGPLPKF